MTKNKKSISANNEPVTIRISETETITTLPDGLVVHETQNRPNNSDDVKWLVEGVVRILPFFLSTEEKLKTEEAA